VTCPGGGGARPLDRAGSLVTRKDRECAVEPVAHALAVGHALPLAGLRRGRPAVPVALAAGSSSGFAAGCLAAALGRRLGLAEAGLQRVHQVDDVAALGAAAMIGLWPFSFSRIIAINAVS
jgi:hypothetical protein